MMQLLCNGVRLDLYEDADIQFTHDNPLFAFDKLSCERTTQFKLPSTPTNDSVLSLARIPAYAGTGMRRRFAAQLQDGVVVKDGYLYIASYDGADYAAVFVTGELVGLQAIKDAGKVADILKYNTTILWDDTSAKAASSSAIGNIDIVQYRSALTHINPSINLKWILDEVAAAVGATIDYTNATSAAKVRLFGNADKYNLPEYTTQFVYDRDNPMSTALAFTMGVLSYATYDACKWHAESVADGQGGYEWDTMNAYKTQDLQYKAVYTPYDITIQFPESTDQNLCLVTGDLMGIATDLNTLGISFLDERRFSYDAQGQVTYTGEPLGGRKVNIAAGTSFMLISSSGYHNLVPQSAGEADDDLGYDINAGTSFDIDVEIAINHDFVYGENVPYNAILPDLTMIDLLRMYAYLCGLVLNYDNGVIKFDPLDFDTWSTMYANRLTKRSEVARSFSDYGQINIVQFDSADYVRPSERIVSQYIIDNDNIESEVELATLSASEGGREIYRGGDDTFSRILVREAGDEQTIADCDTTDTYMQRVSLPPIEGLQSLCTASTQFKIDARMSLAEYNAITAKTLLCVDNTLYVWTSRTWKKDVAQFTLAKI